MVGPTGSCRAWTRRRSARGPPDQSLVNPALIATSNNNATLRMSLWTSNTCHSLTLLVQNLLYQQCISISAWEASRPTTHLRWHPSYSHRRVTEGGALRIHPVRRGEGKGSQNSANSDRCFLSQFVAQTSPKPKGREVMEIPGGGGYWAAQQA